MVSSVTQVLYQTVVVRSQLSQKGTSRSTILPLPVLTSFGQRLICRDGVRSSDIWRCRAAAPSHQKEPVEVVRESDQHASWEPSFGGFPTARKCLGRPTTYCRDYISYLAWDHLGIPQKDGGKMLLGRAMPGPPSILIYKFTNHGSYLLICVHIHKPVHTYRLRYTLKR